MKKIILYFLLVLCVCSCQEKDNPMQMDNIIPSDLNLDDVKHLIPLDLYTDGVSVVFKNNYGDERTLVVSISTEIEELMLEGEPYLSERMDVVLTDPNNENYSLVLVAFSHYTNMGTISKFITCLLTNSVSDFLPSIWISADEKPIQSTNLETEKELLNKLFTNVYSNFDHPSGVFEYSKIYYTIDSGFVGFRDQANTLWVLERFE